MATKWIYQKERSFASNYFSVFENFLLVQEPFIKRWFVVPITQMPILVLFVSTGVSFGCAFSLWVSLPDEIITEKLRECTRTLI